jgi:peptidoglycan/LPS O-acetylase OafA/YrhL
MLNEIKAELNQEHKTRFPELDALRGIAVLWVLFYHYTVAYDIHYKLNTTNKFHFQYGFLAVELFFLISGFVIFLTLEKSKKKTDFLVSRFSRLYPAYWAAMFLTIIILTLLPTPTLGHYNLKEIAVNLTMLQGFTKLRLIDQVYWTLKMELTFYVIMYLIYLSKKLKYITYICFPWLALSLVSCFFKIPLKKYLDVLLILEFAPLFIAGICFYILKKDKKNLMAHLLIVLSLLVELPWVYQYNIDGKSYSTVMMFLVGFYAIFYLFVFVGLPFLNNKFLLFFGSISYSLYLIHNVIGYAIIFRLKSIADVQIFYIPVTFIIVVSLASFVSFYIEKPTMKLIRKWYKKSNANAYSPEINIAQLP